MPKPTGMTTGNAIDPPGEVACHRLESSTGLAVEVLDLGAAVHRVEMPDPDGTRTPLTFSLDTAAHLEDVDHNPFYGVTVGRFANRIGGSAFVLDGTTHRLVANEGNNQLHGGPLGFGRLRWQVDPEPTVNTITLRRISPDGEMGYPGRLDVSVTYTVRDDTIHIRHEATTDAPTVVSLTNHTYWNLGGPSEADIRAHQVQLDAVEFVPVDAASLPCALPTRVEATPFDLRAPAPLGKLIDGPLPDGIDHCFVVAGVGFRRHARIVHPSSGRALEVWSDHPASQLYTGGFLSGLAGADGRSHDRFGALCVEPQHIPNAPNLPWAPSSVLRPGEHYVHEIQFRLSQNLPSQR